MRAKSFGLDIGTTSIKAVWLSRHDKGLGIESVVASPVTSKGILSDNELDQKMFADSLRGVLKSAGVSTRYANISVPESQVSSKVIEMPDLNEKELEAALKYEMEQHIPLPLDQVKTASQTLEKYELEGKKMMNVLIVAAPNSIIERFDRILGFANLIPQTIETEIISVHRSLYPILDQGGADAIVHIGASTTDVAIVKHGVINMIFSIPLGGIAITRAIAIDFGIDPNQAENFKKAYGLTENVFEGKIGKSLEPILQSIIGDIRKALLSFREKYTINIKQVVLSGGSALLPGLHVFFTNILGVQVVVGNAWEVNAVTDVPPEILRDAPSYNVVMGLALRDVT